MSRTIGIVALLAVLGLAARQYSVAQDKTGTPDAAAEFCATPEAGAEASPVASPGASPGASPVASPDIVTSGSPDVIATEVVEEVSGALDVVSCPTPGGTPGT